MRSGVAPCGPRGWHNGPAHPSPAHTAPWVPTLAQGTTRAQSRRARAHRGIMGARPTRARPTMAQRALSSPVGAHVPSPQGPGPHGATGGGTRAQRGARGPAHAAVLSSRKMLSCCGRLTCFLSGVLKYSHVSVFLVIFLLEGKSSPLKIRSF